MSAILGNGSITFADGTVQSTKTPTIVSAFTNDSAYLTSTAAAASYATTATAIHSITADNSGRRPGGLNFYSLTGVYIGTTGHWNCNCNC
jgi:hypothetical protein